MVYGIGDCYCGLYGRHHHEYADTLPPPPPPRMSGFRWPWGGCSSYNREYGMYGPYTPQFSYYGGRPRTPYWLVNGVANLWSAIKGNPQTEQNTTSPFYMGGMYSPYAYCRPPLATPPYFGGGSTGHTFMGLGWLVNGVANLWHAIKEGKNQPQSEIAQEQVTGVQQQDEVVQEQDS